MFRSSSPSRGIQTLISVVKPLMAPCERFVHHLWRVADLAYLWFPSFCMMAPLLGSEVKSSVTFSQLD